MLNIEEKFASILGHNQVFFNAALEHYPTMEKLLQVNVVKLIIGIYNPETFEIAILRTVPVLLLAGRCFAAARKMVPASPCGSSHVRLRSLLPEADAATRWYNQRVKLIHGRTRVANDHFLCEMGESHSAHRSNKPFAQ